MNNYWKTTKGTVRFDLMQKSYKPSPKVGAPFALDYEVESPDETFRPATGFRRGGPKEARLFRVALLKSDKEVDHLFPIRVENLPRKVTEEKLKDKFEEFGEVGNVYIPRNLDNFSPKSFAIVRFVKKEDANRCLAEATDIIMDKKRGPLIVKSVREQDVFFSGHTGALGLTNTATERPPQTHHKFEQSISLDDCMARNGAPWVSKHELLRLEPHAPLESHDSWSIEIKPLASHVTAKLLFETFDKYGHITNVYCPKRLLKDQWTSTPNEGFAYIRFKVRDNAQDAINDYNGKELFGKIVNIAMVPPRYWPRESFRKFF